MIFENLWVTQLLFVDDAICFRDGTVWDAKYFQKAVKLLCEATGMELNSQKSAIFTIKLFHGMKTQLG